MDSVQSAVSKLNVSTLKQLRNQKSTIIESPDDIRVGDIVFYDCPYDSYYVVKEKGQSFDCYTNYGLPRFDNTSVPMKFKNGTVKKIGTLGQDGKIVI